MSAPPHIDKRSQPLFDSATVPWTQQFLLFSLIFAGYLLVHATLLRLPYFWDEAGYYVPAARDLFLTGSWIPHSTPSNAHPPFVMACLALAWRVAGFSTLVTRITMLAFAAFALLGFWQLARKVAHPQVALAATFCTAIYPVFFAQSSLAHVDLPAAGFTFWALAAYVEDRPWKQAVWFSIAALTKETAILAPLALLALELFKTFSPPRWSSFVSTAKRRTNYAHLALPCALLACWYLFHYAKTGYLFGNPEFFRYNVASTLSPMRIPLAFGLRLWQVFGYFGLYLLTLAAILAMFRPPRAPTKPPLPRIAIWIQIAFLAVLLAYLAFMSIVGGAVLARYMLPVTPLVILVLVSTVWRRLRFRQAVIGLISLVFVAGLFTNPPYGFSPEDNLAYRDFIVLHSEADRFLTMRFSGARVLTAWPASDELSRPWLGYVSKPFPVVRIEDFSAPQIAIASAVGAQYDVAYVFSTKYQPARSFLESWTWWQGVKERFFGYHRDLAPEEIAQRLSGRILFHKQLSGQWVAIIAQEREENARSADPALSASSGMSVSLRSATLASR